ncbi:MAG: hypothetical protein Q9211_006177 [Gyalolechia sp. 1 TL-2023]
MARQKSERPKTRHLVRWNGKSMFSFMSFYPNIVPYGTEDLRGDGQRPQRVFDAHFDALLVDFLQPGSPLNFIHDDMDKKLLLTLQWACNKKGVKVPWGMVGAEMGDTITDSAVVQHLAKLRTRMVTEGLPVPPPLTRGGGRSTQVTAPKAAAQRVTKRTANKKTPVKKVPADSDTDEEYDSEEDVRPTIKKGKKKAMPKTRVKKELSSPSQVSSPNGSESDGDHEFGQQSYAVGDAMWDLNSNTNGRAGRAPSSSQSSRSSYQPATKVVALKVGKDALAKLGSSIEAKGYQSSSYGSRANSIADGSLKKSASPNSNATIYGMSDSGGSHGSSPHEPGNAGDFSGYNEEYADAYTPSVSHANETEFEEYSSHGAPDINNFGSPYGAIHYGQADGSGAGNLNTPGFQQNLNTGVNDGPGAPYESFVGNPNTHHGTVPGAGYGVDRMPSSAGNAGFAEAAGTSGFVNEQDSMVALSHNFHDDHSQFFNDSYYGVNGSDFKGPNRFVADHHEIPTHFPHGNFDAAFDNNNGSNQNFEASGNGRPVSDNIDTFSNHTGGVVIPATVADDAGFSGSQNLYPNPHFMPQGFVHSGGYGHEGHNQRIHPQQMSSITLGYPFGGAFSENNYAPSQDYGPFASTKEF